MAEAKDELSPGETAPKKTADAVASVQNKLEALRQDTTIDPGRRDRGEELRSAAQAVSEVAMVDTVAVSTDRLTATAVLKNGIPLVLSNNRPDADTASIERTSAQGAASEARPERRERSSRSDPRLQTLSGSSSPTFPSSKKAIAVAVDFGGPQAAKVRKQLSEAGYDTGSVGASLEEMRTDYKNLGALYLDTHGTIFKTFKDVEGRLTPTGETRYALQTSTKVDLAPSFFKEYGQQLVNRELVLSTFCVLGRSCAEADVSGRGVKVGITDKFVAKHWDFAQGGMAFIHACRIGGSNQANYEGSRALRQAILQDAGAGSLVATKGDTNASILEDGIVSTFEMLLGTARKEFGRPWDLRSTKAALGKMGLLTYEWKWSMDIAQNNVTTRIRFFGNGATRLAPSIRRLKVVDDAAKSKGTLRIKGKFPQDKGRAALGSNALSIQSWGQNEIVARVPFSGSASTGPVRVVHPEGIQGNIVNLTQWTGSMESIVEGKGSQQARSTLEVTFRGDVHPTRERPTAKPTLPKTVETYISPASEGKIKGSGSYIDDNGIKTVWTGETAYQIIGRARIDRWYGGSQKNRTSSRVQGAPGTAGTVVGGPRTQDFPSPFRKNNIFGGKITFRPREGTGQMCLRMVGPVTAKGPDGTATEIPLPQGLWLLESSSVRRLGGQTLSPACMTISVRGLPENPNVSDGLVSVQKSERVPFPTVLSWTAFKAKNQPLPRMDR